jgi:crotonobetainyl-CoA:carnitine CoA-transferase CaiB-like acyl-CoA transferase
MMAKPLEGIKVVEVATWAFVPTCGGMLADLGAEVIKVEAPEGDPLRALQIGALAKHAKRPINYSFESYNRGKRSITLDLRQEAGSEVLMKLLEGADVFITNLLPRARKAMGIDVDTIRSRFPNLIYAAGSGVGRYGPENNKGGFDSITFWARGGHSSCLTDPDDPNTTLMPAPAFGDILSGTMLAGGVCAAIARRALTGEVSEVDVSLLATAMWPLQLYVTQATADGVDRYPRPDPDQVFNLLTNCYRTSDGRFVALNMMQADRYWPGFCEAAGRPDLITDPRFATAELRRENLAAGLAEIRALFASKTLAEWKTILASQDGHWDVVQNVGDMQNDVQVQANHYIQQVDYGDGAPIPLVSMPVQIDGQPLATRRAPELGAHSDAVLESLGYDEEAIIDLKIQGVVF